MADKVYPAQSNPTAGEEQHSTLTERETADKVHPAPQTYPTPNVEQHPTATPAYPQPPASPDKFIPVPSPTHPHQPQPGTYVIQIPKDQVYRVPPPENALRYKHLSKQNKTSGRGCCRRCCISLLIILLILILLLGLTAAIFYFVIKPESPNYTLQSLSIKSLNLTASSPITPQLDFSLSATNPNDKISIYYLPSTSVNLFYHQLNLCNGRLPQFHQPTNNVTVINASLTSSSPIELTSSVRDQLIADEKAGKVPLTVDVRAPVKLRIGTVKTWKIDIKVRCGVTVDKLTSQSKILERNCEYSVDVW